MIPTLTLLRPEWLVALVLLLIIWARQSQRGWGIGGWDKAMDSHLKSALKASGRILPSSVRGGRLALLTGAILVVALSGPAIQRQSNETWRNLNALVLVVDVSRSVQGSGRMREMLLAAQRVGDAARDRPVALVIYAGDSYLASGFSTDAVMIANILTVLDGETVPDLGSRPEQGLARAARALSRAEVLAGDVVLFTDGGGLGEASLIEAEALSLAGHTLSVVHLAEPAGPVSVQALARTGSGVTGTPQALDDVIDTIASAAADPQRSTLLSLIAWHDLGRYLLILALVPAALMIRQGRAA